MLLTARLPAPAPKKSQDDQGRWVTLQRYFTLQQLLTAADMELRTGQVCGRDFYLDPDMGILPGYRGAQAQVGQQRYDVLVRSRCMTKEEEAEYGIIDGDVGFIAEAYSQTTHEVLSVGYGVMTYDELWITEEWQGDKGSRRKVKLAKPKPMYPTPMRPRFWKGHKRAKVDALNQLMGLRPIGAEAVIRAAVREGIRLGLGPEDEIVDSLSHERAQDYVRSARAVQAAIEAPGSDAMRLRVNAERAREAAGYSFMDDDEQSAYRAAHPEHFPDAAPALQGEVVQAGDAVAGGEDAQAQQNSDDGDGSNIIVKMAEYGVFKGAYTTIDEALAALGVLADLEADGQIEDMRQAWIAQVRRRTAAAKTAS